MHSRSPISITCTLAVAIGLCAPAFAAGASTGTLEELREKKQQLRELQSQLEERSEEDRQKIRTEDIREEIPRDFAFSRRLQSGNRSEAVRYLQVVLNADPDTRIADSGPGSPGKETEYFGTKTKEALTAFQEKYAETVLAPWDLDTGTGIAGETTREQLNSILQLARPLSSVTISGNRFQQIPDEFTFTRRLEAGASGSAVRYLQVVLNSATATQVADSGPGSPGNETEYFGQKTKTAVARFQEAYSSTVLEPWGLSEGTGIVGDTTRTQLNELIASRSVPVQDISVDFGHHTPSRFRPVDAVIVHSSYNALEGAPYEIDNIVEEYKQYNVATHYVIGRDGTLYRLVPETSVAFHAGTGELPDGGDDVNERSLGIELIHKKDEEPTDTQYRLLNALTGKLHDTYGFDPQFILGHHEVAPDDRDDPWNFDWDYFASF